MPHTFICLVVVAIALRTLQRQFQASWIYSLAARYPDSQRRVIDCRRTLEL